MPLNMHGPPCSTCMCSPWLLLEQTVVMPLQPVTTTVYVCLQGLGCWR